MISYVKFVRGTPQEYHALIHKNADTLYFVCEADENTAELYLGNKLIAGLNSDLSGAVFLSQLKDVFINEGLSHSQLLVFDAVSQTWVNKSMEEALSSFVGATSLSRGKTGLVPVPKVGQKDFYLKGDGTWSRISSNEVEVAVSGSDASQPQTLTAVLSSLQEQIDAKTAASPITTVSNDFIIDNNKQLQLNNLPISKIEGLEERLSAFGEWTSFS